jgi:hypothetical protein
MGKTLYIHIGAPKCGSTYLQAIIKKNSKVLKKNRILAPSWLTWKDHWMLAALCCDEKQRKYFYNVLGVISQSSFPDFEQNVNALLKKTLLEMNDYDSCLVSSEAYFSFCTSYNSISRLNDAFLHNFERIRLLFFYRDAESYVLSVYSQLVKGPQMYTGSFNDFLVDANQKYIFDLAENIRYWRDLPNLEEFKPIKIGKNGVKGNVLGELFFKFIKIEMDSQIDLNLPKSNVSPNETQLRVLRHTNKFLKLIYKNSSSSEIYQSFSRRIISKIISALPQLHSRIEPIKNEGIIDNLSKDIKNLDKM